MIKIKISRWPKKLEAYTPEFYRVYAIAANQDMRTS